MPGPPIAPAFLYRLGVQVSDSLLPHNATAQERALEAVIAPPLMPPVPLREIWDPETCPANLLPWLAYAFSVDDWNPAWPETAKREVIRQSFQVHRRKGTVGAVKRGLLAIGVQATVVEWWEDGALPDALPSTFEIWLDLSALIEFGADMPALLAQLRRSVDATKPVSAHYTAHARAGVKASAFTGAGSRVSGRVGNRAGIPLAPRVAASLGAAAVSRGAGHFSTPVLEAA